MKRIVLIFSFLFSVPTSATFASDVANGESIFNKKCASCHMVGPDARNSAGPVLNDILDAPVAAVEGFRYSKSLVALGQSGTVWSEEELDKWLIDQKKYVRAALDDKKAKAKMNVKIKKDNERSDLVAYLGTLSTQ